MTKNMNLAQAEFERLCTEGETAGPSTDDAIRRAEKTLSVKFPDEYTDFLKKFGAALLSVGEIYGLPNSSKDEPPMWNDVVDVTNRLRSLGQEGADNNAFLPFSEDGTGVYFYFDTQVSPATKIWAIGPRVRKLVPGTLHEFMLGVAEGRA